MSKKHSIEVQLAYISYWYNRQRYYLELFAPTKRELKELVAQIEYQLKRQDYQFETTFRGVARKDFAYSMEVAMPHNPQEILRVA